LSILDRRDLFFSHHQITGAPWANPPRYSIDERIAAVAAGGGAGVGFDIDAVDEILKERSLADLRALLDQHGVAVGDLEILLGWNVDEADSEGPRAVEARMYALAEGLGAKNIKLSAVIMPDALPPVELLTERYAAVCDRALEHGVGVALEPLAVFPGFDYTVATDIVIAAGRPNGGLLIDGWHWFRDERHQEVLEKLTASNVIGLELCDGYAEPRGTLIEDSTDSRLQPGEGDFDLAGLVRALDSRGLDIPLSIEVLSTELRELSPLENVEQSIAAVTTFLDAVRAPSVVG
jgi:sugar phosphate isomerase/epimerase